MLAIQKTLFTSFFRVKDILSTHPFESLFGVPLLLFFGWYLLALTNLFYSFFAIFLFLLAVVGVVILISGRPAFCNMANGLLIIFLFFFAFLAISTHPVELVSEGRDQGTFINSALLLIEHQGFVFAVPEAKPFFQLYGEGKALHFPGFAYTESGALIPEFPFGYIVWLAGFVSVFGLLGFTLANVFLYVGSGLLLYALLKRVGEPFWSLLGTGAIMAGFLPLWFLSFTLSENLALFLFLLITECTLRFQINRDRVTLFLGLFSALALALTRIEGWAILIIALIILTFKRPKKEWFYRYIGKVGGAGFFGLLFFLTIIVWTFWINQPYYIAIAKALLKSAHQNIAIENLSQEALPLYQVLWEYGLLLPFLLGLLAILYFWHTRRYHLLVPCLLALPTLPYLLLPHITLDAPWMLRRFLFSLYPALLISAFWLASLLITRFDLKKAGRWWLLFFAILLGGQLVPLQHFMQTSYSQTLLPQVESFATHLSSQDLLLIDKDTTGDNFMIPARTLSLLFDKPAVYFFNPADLATLDTSNFNRVLIVTPEDKVATYIPDSERITHGLIRQFTFTNDHSFRSTDFSASTLPKKVPRHTTVFVVEIP